ncbi:MULTISPECIES: MerR family transcriptional regulator [unclassified Caulobacter]|jgi:MerR family copper efflux transcriptional regulator|uniref:MerR family transcriptional regulator n=1 Tax=unclassified Caulobacter TaxID=2648921 RepID=UPI000C15F371|nr:MULTISPECIES: MerR family transcriptional regulator [unclassified Caulobacter]AZS19255.1 MerR family transcriptional regulator [Caulobacter sp. FWC26]PIB90022.1 MerR family transcriptional regulator [Caulobacter sp. FWC2]
MTPDVSSTDMFLSISAMAARLGVSQRALRHYEAVGLIQSYRLYKSARSYDPETVDRLTVIALLRKADVPIATIRAIMSLRPDEAAYLRAVREALLSAQDQKTRELAMIRQLLGDLKTVFTASAQASRSPREVR